MARQVAEYIFHAVLKLSRNVAKSGNLEYFSLNSQRNFLLRDMFRRGDVTAVISPAPYLSTPLRCKLRRKLPRVTWPLTAFGL